MSLCSDKRDILDLVKLSYIIVRTGIGTGQIQVKNYFIVCLFFFNKKRFSWWCLVTHSFLLWPSVIKHNRILKGIRHSMLDLYLCFRPCPVPRAPSGQLYETVCWRAHLLVREAPFCNVVCLHDKYKDKETDSVSWRAHLLVTP